MHATEWSRTDALLAVAQRISEAAFAAGWDNGFVASAWVRGWRRTNNSPSWYCTFSRDAVDEDGDETTEELTVRVSDHDSAYCREDLSVTVGPEGPDERSLNAIFRALAR